MEIADDADSFVGLDDPRMLVSIHARLDRERRYRVQSVEVTADEVTAAMLRAVSLPQALTALLHRTDNFYVVVPAGQPSAGVYRVNLDPEDDDGEAARTVLSEDEVIQVVVTLCATVGVDANRYVATALGCSRSAAAQRVAALRESGQLPKTTRGRRR